MSKKVNIQEIQPTPNGPVYGRVAETAQFQNSQRYAHSHIERVVKDLLMAGAASTVVAGFDYALSGNLKVNLGAGQAITPAGLSHDTLPLGTSHEVTLAAAHPALPRIDLIYALLETDAPAEVELRPYVRLRTQEELSARVPPYAPEQFNQPTESHTRAVILVRTGPPNDDPVAPAIGAGEVALFTVRIDASATFLTDDKVIDVRTKARSLTNALSLVDSLNTTFSETVDDRVNALVVGSQYLTKTYDDPNNTLTLDVDLPAIHAPLDGRYTQNSELNEKVDDRLATLIVDSTGLTKVYDNASNLLTLDVDVPWLDEQIDDRVNDLLIVPPNNGLARTYDDVNNTYTITGVAATQADKGMMSAADKIRLDNLTAQSSSNLPNNVVVRDSNGDFAAGTISIAGGVKFSDNSKRTSALRREETFTLLDIETPFSSGAFPYSDQTTMDVVKNSLNVPFYLNVYAEDFANIDLCFEAIFKHVSGNNSTQITLYDALTNTGLASVLAVWIAPNIRQRSSIFQLSGTGRKQLQVRIGVEGAGNTGSIYQARLIARPGYANSNEVF